MIGKSKTLEIRESLRIDGGQRKYGHGDNPVGTAGSSTGSNLSSSRAVPLSSAAALLPWPGEPPDRASAPDRFAYLPPAPHFFALRLLSAVCAPMLAAA